MQHTVERKAVFLLVGGLLFLAGCLVGQQAATTQKTLMHVFAYTPLEGATQQDFENLKKATVDMIGKIPGLRKVWVGKLREPLPQESRLHTYGVAMEFDDAEALAVYADHPAHVEWVRVYEKVRMRGTTTLDILGE
ncbi:MAG: Dabb family protein [Acidobacteria bacterium]|nr:Dabb family protein [Acidobacteriota bacterium]